MNHIVEQRRNEQLQEARRIFIDANSYPEQQLIPYYNLAVNIFEGEDINSNCILIEALEAVAADLNDSEVLFLKYFCGLSFAKIAQKLPTIKSVSSASSAHKRALKQLRYQKRKYYLPSNKAFIKQYGLFIDAVLAGKPSKNDLPIQDLNLSTRTANALLRVGITTASQMYFTPLDELYKIHNLGETGVKELQRLRSYLMSWPA